VVALLLFFHDPDFRRKTAKCCGFSDNDKYRPALLSDIWINILLKHTLSDKLVEKFRKGH
jgi:hypothetical protein